VTGNLPLSVVNPGAPTTETLHVSPRQLPYWSDAQQQWVLDAGARSVGDADAPANLPLRATRHRANGTTPPRSMATCRSTRATGVTSSTRR
jgi:hypothetical protein